MAFDLSTIKKRARLRPPKICIYGGPGIGKTTFAAGMTDPIFAMCEDGQGMLSIASLTGDETIKDFRTFTDGLDALIRQEHDFRTLVVDSMSALEPIVWAEVASRFNAEDISRIDYGKGWAAAKIVFIDEILARFNVLNERRRMTICLIGHSKVERYHPPTGDSYDRYTLEMREQVASAIEKWVDALLYCDFDQHVVTTTDGFTETKKAKTSGVRVMWTSNTLACVAKNRLGLPKKVPMDWAQVRGVIAENGKKALLENPKETKGESTHKEAQKTVQDSLPDAPEGGGEKPEGVHEESGRG